ncbi:MAG: hypothetical protein ACK56I_31165, partial [bacterium]
MHGLVKFQGTNPQELLDSLAKARPPMLSPLEVTKSLGLQVHPEFDLRNLPLGLIVQVCKFDQVQT